MKHHLLNKLLVFSLMPLFASGCSAQTRSAPAEINGPAVEDDEYLSFAPPMETLYQNRVQAQSDKYLSVHLFDMVIDHQKAANAANFKIISADDTRYAGVGSQPLKTSSRTRSVRVSDRKDMLVKETTIFLQLPQPMQNGKSYAVTIGDLGAEVPALPSVVFNDRRQTNDNIRLNHLGYLPGHQKFAYLGQYMGSGGGMEFDAQQFELLDANDKSTFKGEIKRRGVRDELVGQIVYELNFSAFKTPGNYRIFIPGVGLSHPFVIADNALTPAFVNLMRGSYHQRCGHDVAPEYSRHHRVACHLDDAFIEERANKLNFVQTKQPLYPARYDRHQEAIHGHHDAGDYGKYTTNGAAYVVSVLQAYDLFPEKFAYDNLNLPYSGNGIPDLIDEVKWELDWLENMQDPDDGGVFGVIRPNTGGYENSMPPAKAHRLFFPKDTVFTGAYAGALARAARSPLMQKHYPEDAKRYLQKAIKAWEWLEKNKTFVKYFHYGQEFEDWDERNWAAIELYAASGEEKYHRYFLQNFDPGKRRWEWWGLFEAAGYANNAYAFLQGRERDAAMVKRCEDAIRSASDKHIRESAAYPYRMSMPTESINHKSYGWYFPASTFGYDLLVAYALDKKPEYLETILHNLSYSFGANPTGFFLQTGLGHKRNIEVVDNESTFDGIIQPVPGIPLGIGSPGFYWLNRYERRPSQNEFPADWPLMNRWYDGFNVSSEFTIEILIREAIVTGFFADLGQDARPAPKVEIKANTTSGPAPLKVQFNAETTAPGGKIRQVFWDFDDESFSTSPAPRHIFEQEGREYTVAVTVVDENGMTAYDTVRVAAVSPAANHPSEEFKLDEQTVALFHLNGDLRDASNNKIELTVKDSDNDRKPYQFAELPPLWMEKASGKAIEMDGHEQFVATIPAAKIPAGSAVTMEMMLYLRDFAGWGYSGDPVVFGLTRDWDDWLGWKQETWDKNVAPFFGGGARRIVNSDQFAADFPRNRWAHLKIVDDGKGSVEFLVNGESVGKTQGRALNPDKRGDVNFTVGPFRGMVDEIRISTAAR